MMLTMVVKAIAKRKNMTTTVLIFIRIRISKNSIFIINIYRSKI